MDETRRPIIEPFEHDGRSYQLFANRGTYEWVILVLVTAEDGIPIDTGLRAYLPETAVAALVHSEFDKIRTRIVTGHIPDEGPVRL